MRRSRMPVRMTIHSSLVSRKVARSALVRTAGGRHLPQPVMAAYVTGSILRGFIGGRHSSSLWHGSPPDGRGRAADVLAVGKLPALTSCRDRAAELLLSQLAVSIGASRSEAGLEAGALQQVDEVLGGDVAGRVRGERAAADAAEAGVEHVDAGL